MVVPRSELLIEPLGNSVAGIGHGVIINIADLIFAGQPFDIAQVVPVMVGNNHGVDFIHTLLHTGLGQRHFQGSAAAVAQLVLFIIAHIHHYLALTILQQDGITLAHIQQGYPQLARRQGRCTTRG